MAEGSLREEYDRARPDLWPQPGLLSWRRLAAGCQLVQALEGAPPDAECRLIISVPDRPWPAGSFSLIWHGVRLFGLDLDGPPHRLANGRAVGTPHWQTLAADGSEHVAAMNLWEQAVTSLEQALRWFVRAAGVEWGFRWVDPPLQAGFEGAEHGRVRGLARRPAARRRR